MLYSGFVFTSESKISSQKTPFPERYEILSKSAVVFSGTVAGTYEEYGVTVAFLNAAGDVITVDFPAYGCNEDGSYFVAIKGASDFDGDAVQSVTGYIK